MSLSVIAANAVLSVFCKSSQDLAFICLKIAFTFDHISSIEFKSAEYTGKNQTNTPHDQK